MRTNIDIDDDLIAAAMEYGPTTKKAAVEEALKLFVRMRAQQALLDLRGKVEWTGDLDAMREGRIPAE